MDKRTRRVLVIDGVRERRQSIRATLEADGFEVSIAGNGRRGLGILRTKRFDILLTDICTPQADGLAVLKRARDEQSHLRVFAMAIEDARMSIEVTSTLAEVWGAERVFTRQFDAAALLAALGRKPGGASAGSPRTNVR